jgi:hypothetical protein
LTVLAAAGIITPGMALADWNKAAFDAKSMADTLKALGAGTPADSKDVQVTGPDIAENGAVVPVGVSSTLPNVTMVAILIEKNPNALAASLQFAGRHRSQCPDPRQDGPDLQRLRTGQVGWQVLHGDQGNQGHPGRLRRLIGHDIY